MAEPSFPVANERNIEEERQDAIFYKNPFMYELCELAALGLLAKNLCASTLEIGGIADELRAFIKKQEENNESPRK